MKDKGNQIDLIYVKELNVNPCQGDQSCWTRTPGKCFQDDDMQRIYQKLREADLVVLATPVYVDGMTGALKCIVDRLIPTIEPYIELRGGHCRHPLRAGYKCSKAVLVSSCGFWEVDNFAPLVAHMKAICLNTGWEYVGALLRPHSSALGYMLRKGLPVQDVIEAAREAGRQIVKTSRIEEGTINTVGRELVPLETYVDILNRSFKRILDSIQTT